MSGRVIIRADASAHIGSGHIMRCLVLADELKAAGKDVVFVCRLLTGHSCEYIEQRGYRVLRVPSDIPLQLPSDPEEFRKDIDTVLRASSSSNPQTNWLIIDHYSIDHTWEKAVRNYFDGIFVIDDFSNRYHTADLLLNQNIPNEMAYRYHNLVPHHCKLLLGPEFLLLRPDFYTARRNLRNREGKLNRLLVFFGGSDPTNETKKVLQTLKNMVIQDIRIDIIIGRANHQVSSITQSCKEISNVELHFQIENMAELIANADFALGAGGVSMWERCYLGLPSAVVIQADNQQEASSWVSNMGAVWYMGEHHQVTAQHYESILYKALSSPQALEDMSSRGLELTAGKGDKASQVLLSCMR